jgi:adenine-specific DNA-methyltransferase
MPTLTWVGKDKVVNHHLDVPFRVLQRESHFDAPEGTPANSTDNRIIHGDNLAALKSLLPEFEGKINCIYIDPPYNTGNESWVYNDAVNDPKIKKWLGQVVGKEGEDLSRHDKWLCMMYPRLKLLYRLLAKDGVIFISIDDNEQANLKLICDEIFGAGNFVANFVWQKAYSPRMDSKTVSNDHDHVLVYSKTQSFSPNRIAFEQNNSSFSKFDEHKQAYYRRRQWRKEGSGARREDRPNLFYELKSPDNTPIFPIRPDGSEGRWRGSNDYFNSLITEGVIEWVKQEDSWQIYVKQYLDTQATKPASTWLSSSDFSHNHEAAEEIRTILQANAFSTPKPTTLIQHFLNIATDKNSIILDSFAGSGTTAHAVLKLNAQDQGNRRFILIEMEDYADTITAERVRRVMSGYGEGNKQTAGLGGSFDYYTIGAAIFNADDTLNEAVGLDVIRDYVSYSEVIPTECRTTQDNAYTPYLLGLSSETAWLFYYKEDAVTCLDLNFLGSLKFGANKPETAIIYADKSLLDKEFMTKHNIIFKKIPRDITRF